MKAAHILKLATPVGVERAADAARILHQLGYPRFKSVVESMRTKTRADIALSLVEYIPIDITRACNVAVDVGANIGDWSNAILNLLNPKSIIAVEPSSQCFRQLQDRFKSDNRMHLEHVALGQARGEATLNVFAESAFNSLLRPHQRMHEIYGIPQGFRPEDVKIETLDDVLLNFGVDQIDLLKIDVQGGEREVLAGAISSLQRTRCVLLEIMFIPHYEDESLFCVLNEQMNRLGFQIHALGPVHSTSQGQAVWADAIYLPEASLRDR